MERPSIRRFTHNRSILILNDSPSRYTQRVTSGSRLPRQVSPNARRPRAHIIIGRRRLHLTPHVTFTRNGTNHRFRTLSLRVLVTSTISLNVRISITGTRRRITPGRQDNTISMVRLTRHRRIHQRRNFGHNHPAITGANTKVSISNITTSHLGILRRMTLNTFTSNQGQRRQDSTSSGPRRNRRHTRTVKGRHRPHRIRHFLRRTRTHRRPPHTIQFRHN